MSNGKKAIVLSSGGLDSTTVMAMAKAEGYDIYSLSFRYGQRHKVELEAAQGVAKAFGANGYFFETHPNPESKTYDHETETTTP